MTKESICVRCAELITLRVKRVRRDENFIEEIMVCPERAIDDSLGLNDVVEGCSRFVEVPKEGKDPEARDRTLPKGARYPRPRYLPHGDED